MAAMPAHLLKDLFENPLPKRVEDAGLRDEVLRKMTKEKVHDIFSEIGQWYENIRRNTESDFEAVEKLNQLKGFLGKLLGSPASRQVPPMVVSNSEKSSCRSWLARSARSANAAFPALGQLAAFAL